MKANARDDQQNFMHNGRAATGYVGNFAGRMVGSCREAVRTHHSTKSTRAFAPRSGAALFCPSECVCYEIYTWYSIQNSISGKTLKVTVM